MREKDIASNPKGYAGYLLEPGSRSKLAGIFPPQFPEFIGHHVTEQFGVRRSEVDLPESVDARVVGYAQTDGLEALVVEIDGSTTRPDGSTYHITWSLDRSQGFKPVHSNNLLKNGWQNVDPINIHVTPQFFEMRK
jgi:hypothetical protein